jgi:hypothetical protein
MINKTRRSIVIAGALVPVVPYVFGASSIITNENLLAGAADWRVQKWPTFFDWSANTLGSAPYNEIEGYCSAHSVNIGNSIQIFVNCQEPTYTLKIFRLGWYGGAGSRLMLTQNLTGRTQTIPTPNALGTVDCNWVSSYSLTVPTNWVSGIYLVKLIAGNSRVESLISFVVRDDARVSDLVLASTYNTSQAYNNWGGKSLYEFNSLNGARATAISFNRPDVDGGGCGQVMHWELSMARFLEREGYDVKYIANNDVHVNSSILLKSKVFLSVGHDEYWTYEMKQNVMAAQAAGISTAFMAANSCYWQVRMNGRVMTSYKENSDSDPYVNIDRKRITSQWRLLGPNYGVSDSVATAENGMIGVMYHGDPVNSDLIVTNPTHWLYAGTGVVAGTRFPGLLGYETDSMVSNGLAPVGIEKVMESPDPFGLSHATVATLPSGAIVFGSGTMQWSWGVDFCPSWAPNSGLDRSSEQFRKINRNLLNRMIAVVGTGLAAPTNLRVTAGTNPILQWDVVTGATSYDVYRALTPNAALGVPYRPGVVSPIIADSGLTPGVTYYYKVVARNGSTSSPPSAEISFTAAGVGGIVLAPTGLTGYSCNTGCWAFATQGGPATRVNWTQSTSASIVSNGIYRWLNGGTPALVATVPAATTYIDKNVVLNTTYHYQVTAIDKNGNVSPMSNSTSFAFLP